MPETLKTYRKFQSFIELRHHKALPDVFKRLESLQQSLSAAPQADAKTFVLRKACEEALGKTPGCGEYPPFQLHTNVIEEISRIADEELPRYLYSRYRYEIYPQRLLLDEYPPCVQIEPTSVCNYRCVFCYQTDPALTRKNNGHMGMMPLSTFKKAVDQIKGHVEIVTLASRGEPLICPDISAMLAYVRGKFLALKMNTNAWFLDERKCHAILEADIGTLVFSADAAAEPAYSQLRVGGNLERVLKNVRLFQEIRAKKYPRSRTITRVSGVQFPGSGNLTDMDKLWGSYVDQVAFVDYNPWENTYKRPINDIATPCSDLWRRLFIWWDGRANPCDVDYLSTLSVGTLEDRSISKLWQSKAYRKLREDHRSKKRGQHSPCARCTVV